MGYQERLRFTAEDGSAWSGMLRPDWAQLEPLLSLLPEPCASLSDLVLKAGLQVPSDPAPPEAIRAGPELATQPSAKAHLLAADLSEDWGAQLGEDPDLAVVIEDPIEPRPEATDWGAELQPLLLTDGRGCVLSRLPPLGAWLPRASLARQRFELIHRLWALGVPAVRALAYLEGPRSAPSWLLTEACAAKGLPSWAASAGLRARRELAEQLGRAIGRLKRAGLALDLQADGWCVDAAGPRLRAVRPGPELPEEERLAALAAGLPTRASERVAFLRGYLQHELGGAKARRRALMRLPSR